MGTLIVYSTKYGFTKTCVEKLADMLEGETDIVDLGTDTPDLGRYDRVIVGGSVYMGKIRKPVARFCDNNMDALKGKKLGLFICGLVEGEEVEKEIESVFPEELLNRASAKESFGGAMDFEKMNFVERFIFKKASGSDENKTIFLEENMDRFAHQMNGA